MANLLSLPTELLMNTMAGFEPVDLLRFSHVCRRTSEVAGQRSAWERAFRSTCEKAQVFEPSYHPIEALDLGALKKGALGPKLLAQTLTAWQGILPAREMVLETDDMFEEPSHPIGVQLVPGGRYVIGGTERCISLWDIGAIGTPLSRVSPLNSFVPDSPHWRYWSISAPSSHLGSYLRFFVLLWSKQQIAGYIIIRNRSVALRNRHPSCILTGRHVHGITS
ncbi:hypothetical protein FA13DRAFT_84925 [Coprinellus micaceus]|uniref:F-box domain-containing protein n=1 Tax=Coprinellus micaceus TaxID=71717 RepID=A0A4Y7TJP3_COPMI|nr:hypothetical protein FA13DRAFT_84925 [Coprinellus micaceus]